MDWLAFVAGAGAGLALGIFATVLLYELRG